MTDDPIHRTATGESSRRTFLKSGAVATGALTLGTGAVASGNVAQDDDEDDDGGDGQDDDGTPFAAVEFSNQESDGTEVVVDSHTLSESGYVAFHGPSLLDGEVVESVVGVTDYLEPGIAYRTSASLFDVVGADFERSELAEPTPVVAMPHRETGDNEEYDFVDTEGAEDGPFVEDGLPVVDLAYVAPTGADDGAATDDGTPTGREAAETEDGTPFAAVDFSNQTVDDDEVTVGEVVLSEGGFVALHDARLFEGDALGSVVGVSEYLEPGRHREVEIEVDDADDLTEVALPAPPLVPMPHMDTDGDEKYDFVTSEGAEDGPYTKAENPVVDIGLVNLEEDDEGAETETDDDDDDSDDDADDDATDTNDDDDDTDDGADDDDDDADDDDTDDGADDDGDDSDADDDDDAS